MKPGWPHLLIAFLAAALIIGAVALLLSAPGNPSSTLSREEGPISTTPTLEPATHRPGATDVPSPSPPATSQPPTPTVPRAPTASALQARTPTSPPADPFSLLSQEDMFAFLDHLTGIQPYSGWRSSASEGESEALDYITEVLEGYDHLQARGLEVERQIFNVFLGTDQWETRLHLRLDDQELEVPTNGLRAPRDDTTRAVWFDSDGALNDSERDPVIVEGPVELVRSAEGLRALDPNGLRDKIVFLDYALIDRIVEGAQRAGEVAGDLLAREPAGLVLVTTNSNQPGVSHGTFVGDSSVFTTAEVNALPPILYVRLEDLAPAGIMDWAGLEQIQSARLTWDADVFSPAPSGNLVARIPGADPSRAVILGAHVDSPNTPGALDDGSGSVVLLEIARVLETSQVQPPTDLYLVWFGSEEIGLYGSAHFAATHQELLDQTLGMLQTDMLSHPLDGINADLTLVAWSYDRHGDGRLLWPGALSDQAAERGIETVAHDVHYFYSDNGSFTGYDVPNADLIYEDARAMEATGSIHYATHIHDPYDTVDLVREMGDVLEEMAQVALAAALEVPKEVDLPALRVAPRPHHRVLLVASHTEPVHMTPAGLVDLGMTLAMEGFDVDLVPYGQPVTAADLEATELVIVLPVVDYPSPANDPSLSGATGGAYDEAWSEQEIAALEAYVAGGGLLVLTNSAHRLKYGNLTLDPNEDWSDANALAQRFGVTYRAGTLPSTQAFTTGENPLVEGIRVLEMPPGNGLPFTLDANVENQVLALAGDERAAVLLDHGPNGGQVLVLADVGILGSSWGPPANLIFWRNLAGYARR